MPDPESPATILQYRVVYGVAAHMADVAASHGADGEESISAVVTRRFSHYDAEIVHLAIDDAISGRRPRW